LKRLKKKVEKRAEKSQFRKLLIQIHQKRAENAEDKEKY